MLGPDLGPAARAFVLYYFSALCCVLVKGHPGVVVRRLGHPTGDSQPTPPLAACDGLSAVLARTEPGLGTHKESAVTCVQSGPKVKLLAPGAAE